MVLFVVLLEVLVIREVLHEQFFDVILLFGLDLSARGSHNLEENSLTHVGLNDRFSLFFFFLLFFLIFFLRLFFIFA